MELKDIGLIIAGVAGVAGVGYLASKNDTLVSAFDSVTDKLPDVDEDKCWCVLVDEAWKCTCDVVNEAGEVIGFETPDYYHNSVFS